MNFVDILLWCVICFSYELPFKNMPVNKLYYLHTHTHTQLYTHTNTHLYSNGAEPLEGNTLLGDWSLVPEGHTPSLTLCLRSILIPKPPTCPYRSHLAPSHD